MNKLNKEKLQRIINKGNYWVEVSKRQDRSVLDMELNDMIREISVTQILLLVERGAKETLNDD